MEAVQNVPPHACDELLSASPENLKALQKQCHHERAMVGMHEGMSMIGSFLSVIDQGIEEEMDLESTDPTFLGAANHEEHMDHLATADQALRGSKFAAGFLDSFPGMIERFGGADYPVN